MGGRFPLVRLREGDRRLNTQRTIRVLPDVSGLDNEFDYLVDARDHVEIGSIVRVDLHGRRVRGWVTALDVEPPEGVALRPVSKVSSLGPDHELQDLARWASARWGGVRGHYLTTSSPQRNIVQLPDSAASVANLPDNLQNGTRLIRLGPAIDPFEVVEEATANGPCLVLAPGQRQAQRIAERLKRLGRRVVTHPDGWAAAAAGGVTVVGTRSAVWTRLRDVSSIVMIDCADEAHWSEASPTWNAFDVAAERAARRNIPFLAVSPVLRATHGVTGRLDEPDRTRERAAWAPLHVVDTRKSDPFRGLYSDALVKLLRSEQRVVCVLNRKGRAQLLVCAACDTVAACERCNGAETLTDSGLICRRCSTDRGTFCAACGSERLKQLRQGVTKVAEELQKLALRPVADVAAESDALPDASVLVGTEAVLHRVGRADAVVFLEFDQELLAERYKAEEDALILLARAARLVGGRRRNGLVVVQTRQPDNEVIAAATAGNPDLFSKNEDLRRKELGWPPYSVLARLSGPRAEAAVEVLPQSIEAFGPDAGGKWMVKACSHEAITAALSVFKRKGRELRVEIDPARA